MKNIYQDALDAQNACNPGALCRSLAQVQTDLMAQGLGTDDVRKNPACRLMAYQIAFLFDTAGLESLQAYREATAHCIKLASQ